jgi:hypothetical protein
VEAPEVISLIAVGGTLAGTLLGTLGGVLLQSRLTAGREIAADLRERRLALYLDAAAYAQYRSSHLDWVCAGVDSKQLHGRQAEEPPHADTLTARMQLLAHGDVRDAWFGVLAAWEDLYVWIKQVAPPDEAGNPKVPGSHPEAMALRIKIEVLEEELRMAATRHG